MDNLNNTSTSDQTATPSYINDYIAGSCFLLTSISGLFGYAFVLPAIAFSKKLRHPCYAFMFSLGISDSISLLMWFLIGIHTLTHGSLIPTRLITHSICILVVGWGSLTVHIGVLAINRYFAICRNEKHSIVFSRRRVRFILTGCWTYAIFVHALPTFLPPNMKYTLDGYAAYWENPIITDYYYIEDITWCSSVFMLDLACYTAIIIRYRKVRKQFSGLSSNDVNARVRQFRLALQCMIRCCAFFFYDLLYYVIGYLTQDIWITFICSTYLWAFNNALSPCLYFMFDRQLRTVVRKWFSTTGHHPVSEQQPVTTIRLAYLMRGKRISPVYDLAKCSGNSAADPSRLRRGPSFGPYFIQ